MTGQPERHLRDVQIVLLIIATLASAPAAAYLPAPYGGTIVVPLPGAALTLDPAQASREAELMVCELLYDTLFHFRSPRRQRPHLLQGEPAISADGKIWRLRLRAGVTLHDGSALTVAQVVASLRRARRGAQGYLLAPVERIAAGDEQTIVIRLKRRTPRLRILLSAPATAIVVRKQGKLLGSGPFALVSRGAETLRLRAHAAHFAGRPYVDGIAFKVFRRANDEVASFQVGALQISTHGKSVFGGRPRFPAKEVSTPPRTAVYLAVGTRPAHVADPLFRGVLRAAIDRQRVRRQAGSGKNVVASGLVSRSLLRHRRRRAAFDRALANRLMAKLAQRHAAVRAAALAGRMRVSLLTDASRPDDQMVAQSIVADLDRVGVAVSVDAQPAAEYQARLRAGRYQLALGRLALQLADGPVALAGAWAASGQLRAAARCVAARVCGRRDARLQARRSRLLPLVHAGLTIDYDARLGAVIPDGAGRLPYAAIYRKR